MYALICTYMHIHKYTYHICTHTCKQTQRHTRIVRLRTESLPSHSRFFLSAGDVCYSPRVSGGRVQGDAEQVSDEESESEPGRERVCV